MPPGCLLILEGPANLMPLLPGYPTTLPKGKSQDISFPSQKKKKKKAGGWTCENVGPVKSFSLTNLSVSSCHMSARTARTGSTACLYPDLMGAPEGRGGNTASLSGVPGKSQKSTIWEVGLLHHIAQSTQSPSDGKQIHLNSTLWKLYPSFPQLV